MYMAQYEELLKLEEESSSKTTKSWGALLAVGLLSTAVFAVNKLRN